MKPLLRATAVSMLLVLLGTAPAVAHDRTATTRITLNANKSVVDAGEKVKFRGRLNSGWNKCRKWKLVSLRRDGTMVDSKQTMRNGKFRFTKRVQNTSNWRARFAGRTWGQHPHNHVCFASVSSAVRVRVRGDSRAGGGADAAGTGGSGGTIGVAGVGGDAGGTEVLAAGGGSALTGSDFLGAAGAAIALGAIGVAGLLLSRRRARPTS